MPARWNILTGVSKEISSIISGRIGLLYAPFVNMLVFYPSLSINLMTNLDVDLFLQSLYGPRDGKFSSFGQLVFLRGKFSF